MENTKEAKEETQEQEDDLYFEDMDFDSGIPELDFSSYDGLGRIPKTRFTNMSLW